MNSEGKTEELRKNSTHEAYWQSRARLVVIIINAFWILTLGLNLITGMALLYIVLIICRFGADAVWFAALVFGLSSVLVLVRRIRNGTFMSWQDGLILLEDRLGLESALSSAHDGAAGWPPPKRIPRLFQPRVRLLVLPVLALSTAWLVPGGPESYAVTAGEIPNRTKQLQKTLDKIKEQKLVDPQEVEKLAQSMEELTRQDTRNWFSPESMEAIDNLQERLDAAIDANEKALNNLGDAFSALKNQPVDSDAGKRSDLVNKMEESLGNLSSGALPLDPQILNQLRDLSDSTGSADEAEKAIQALKGAQEGFGSLNEQGKPGSGSPGRTTGAPRKEGNQGTDKKSGDHSSSKQSGNGTCNGESGDKEGNTMKGKSGHQTSNNNGKGSGGIARGPGEAPLNLFEKPPAMTSQSDAELKSSNEQDDTADEITSIIRRRPEVLAPDENNIATDITTQSGSSAATWKDSLTPDEEETLKQVLK
jgi:hypothetical protein